MVRRFLLIVVLISISAGSAQAAGWNVVAFNSESVSVVEVHPFNEREIAAVANGRLMLSRDRGTSWTQSPVPLVARTISYDPVYEGLIYAGTDSGVYISRNSGVSWQLLEQIQTGKKITVALQTTKDSIFAVMNSGAGTANQVWRFGRDGSALNTSFVDTNASSFDYDYARHRLFVGARNGVYFSDSGGATWQKAGNGGGVFVGAVVVKDRTIWAHSSDGLFQAADGITWKKLAGPADINGTYYGNDVRLTGLAVSGNNAFYGAASIAFPYRFLVQYDSGAKSVLAAKVAGVAASGGRIWAATDTGLQVNDDLITREARVSRPVIIIPGILGSLPTTDSLRSYFQNVADGEWDSQRSPLALDPVRQTYDGLIDYLIAQGYERDKTIFPFPYDWTRDNARTAEVLAAKITAVKRICACSEVDLVGHSMGGLVARSYVQGDHYQGDVKNLIQVGAPNQGAIEAYEVWEGGKTSFSSSSGSLLNILISMLSRASLDDERGAAVRQFIPSVGQLLPIWNYIQSRQYPLGYPENQYLVDLQSRADILKQRVAYYVLGSSSHSTAESITVSPADGDKAWPHGEVTGRGFGLGDGTVLGSSLEGLGRIDVALKGDHGSIVTESSPHIARILMGGYVADRPLDSQQQRQYNAVYVRGSVAAVLSTSAGEVAKDVITIPGAYFGKIFGSQLALLPASETKYRLMIKNSSAKIQTYSVGIGSTEVVSEPNEAASTIHPGDEVEVLIDFGVTAADAISLPEPKKEAAISVPTHENPSDKPEPEVIQPTFMPGVSNEGKIAFALSELSDSGSAPSSTGTNKADMSPASSPQSSSRLPFEILVTALVFVLLWRIGRMLA